jgi:hypothetical protein
VPGENRESLYAPAKRHPVARPRLIEKAGMLLAEYGAVEAGEYLVAVLRPCGRITQIG